MLQGLKARLKLMAADASDPFFSNLSRRVGEAEASYYEQSLRNLILMMPDMLEQSRAWMSEPGVSPGLRHAHGFVISYIFNSRDVLPEETEGLFGYLDDAYLVGLTYQRVEGELAALSGRPPSDSHDISAQLPRWMQQVREVIPKEAEQVERLMEDLLAGNAATFNAAMDVLA